MRFISSLITRFRRIDNLIIKCVLAFKYSFEIIVFFCQVAENLFGFADVDFLLYQAIYFDDFRRKHIDCRFYFAETVAYSVYCQIVLNDRRQVAFKRRYCCVVTYNCNFAVSTQVMQHFADFVAYVAA